MQAYVGIDVHRRRPQIAVMDESGRTAVNRNVPNGRETVLGVIGDLPVGTLVVFEAAYGWGWLIELLQDYGFEPHLAHPLQCKAIAAARLKNDKVDAATLAHLLRTDLLPEAWIAPPDIREQRAVLRHRAQLVRLRTLLRNRIHAVLADHGCDRGANCFSGVGREWLQTLPLPEGARRTVADRLEVIDALQAVIDRLGRVLDRAGGHPLGEVARDPVDTVLAAHVMLAASGVAADDFVAALVQDRDGGEPCGIVLVGLDDDKRVVLVVELADQLEQRVLGRVIDVVAVLAVCAVVPGGHWTSPHRALSLPASAWHGWVASQRLTATGGSPRSAPSPRTGRRACHSGWPPPGAA